MNSCCWGPVILMLEIVLEMFLFLYCFVVKYFFSGSSILKLDVSVHVIIFSFTLFFYKKLEFRHSLHIFLLNSNRFLNFSFKMFQWLGLVSYKLVSYKEKRCFVGAFEAQIFLKKVQFFCCRCFSSTGFVTFSEQQIPLRLLFSFVWFGLPHCYFVRDFKNRKQYDDEFHLVGGQDMTKSLLIDCANKLPPPS